MMVGPSKPASLCVGKRTVRPEGTFTYQTRGMRAHVFGTLACFGLALWSQREQNNCSSASTLVAMIAALSSLSLLSPFPRTPSFNPLLSRGALGRQGSRKA